MWQRAPVDQQLCSMIIFVRALKAIHILFFFDEEQLSISAALFFFFEDADHFTLEIAQF